MAATNYTHEAIKNCPKLVVYYKPEFTSKSIAEENYTVKVTGIVEHQLTKVCVPLPTTTLQIPKSPPPQLQDPRIIGIVANFLKTCPSNDPRFHPSSELPATPDLEKIHEIFTTNIDLSQHSRTDFENIPTLKYNYNITYNPNVEQLTLTGEIQHLFTQAVISNITVAVDVPKKYTPVQHPQIANRVALDFMGKYLSDPRLHPSSRNIL